MAGVGKFIKPEATNIYAVVTLIGKVSHEICKVKNSVQGDLVQSPSYTSRNIACLNWILI